MNALLIQYLSEFITKQRLQLFHSILENRTRYMAIVLEDIFQPQNASAVVRSADCFGIHDVHVIENRNKFNVDTEVAMGSSKWINLQKHNKQANNTAETLSLLKSKGYRIVVTSPHQYDTKLEELDLQKGKVALVFGTELTGVSTTASEMADEFVKIPMYGFTESLNISVSAAIIMHYLTLKMKSTSGLNWQLSKDDREDILLQWLRSTIKSSDLLEKQFFHLNNLTDQEN